MTKAAAKTSASTELKILQQQEFLNPDSAARYLTLRLDVAVTEATLWDLTLQQKVLVSIQTTSLPINAYPGEVREGRVAFEQIVGDRAAVNLDDERSIHFDLGSTKSQELTGVFDISGCGGWRGIVMKLRNGDEWAARVNELPVCYQDPGDPLRVWVRPTMSKHGYDVSDELAGLLRIGFRRAALDAFVLSTVGKTADDSDEKPLNLNTALKIFGGVLHVIKDEHTKTTLKAEIKAALGAERFHAFGGRTMDDYFARATKLFDAAASDRMDANSAEVRK